MQAGRVRAQGWPFPLSWSSPVLPALCALEPSRLSCGRWRESGSPDGRACPPTTCVDVPPSWPQSPDLGFGAQGSPLSAPHKGRKYLPHLSLL